MVRISLDDDQSFTYDDAEWRVLETPKDTSTIDDYNDDEEEPPHPLGFSSSLGRTRFSMDAENEEESIQQYKHRWGYLNPLDRSNNNNSSNLLTSPIQQYPPLHSYLDPETAPTAALLRYDYKQKRQSVASQEDPIDKITILLKASSIVDETTILSPIRQIEAIQQEMYPPQHVQQQRDLKIKQRVERYRARFAQEQEEAAQALASLLQRQEAKAQQEQKRQERQRQEDERQRLEQEEERLKVEEEKRKAEVKSKEQEVERVAKEEAVEQEARNREEELRNRELEYIGRAKKLVADLVQLRASVESFESSKAVSKRRLGVKKIANGKVNTLTEDPAKVRSVATEVSQAIAATRAEDAEAKQRLQAQDPSVSEEMTRGKRYFLDFLSCKAIVRAQADGFNGCVQQYA